MRSYSLILVNSEIDIDGKGQLKKSSVLRFPHHVPRQIVESMEMFFFSLQGKSDNAIE